MRQQPQRIASRAWDAFLDVLPALASIAFILAVLSCGIVVGLAVHVQPKNQGEKRLYHQDTKSPRNSEIRKSPNFVPSCRPALSSSRGGENRVCLYQPQPPATYAQNGPAGEMPAPNALPVLNVWHAAWCGPCVQFWRDYSTDASFKARIDAHYRINWVDANTHPIAAFLTGCLHLDGSGARIPYFYCDTNCVRFSGYTTKQDLLCRLRLSQASDFALPVPKPQPEDVPPPAPGMAAVGASGSAPAQAPNAGGSSRSPAAAPASPSGNVGGDQVAQELSQMRSTIEGIQKAVGDQNPNGALATIDSKLGKLQTIQSQIDAIKQNVPQPVQAAVETAVANALPKVVSQLASAGPATGLLGAVASIAAGIGIPPLGLALGAGALVWGIGSWLWGKLRGNVTVPGAAVSLINKAASAQAAASASASSAASSAASAPQSAAGGPVTAFQVPVAVTKATPQSQLPIQTQVVEVPVDNTSNALAWAKAQMAAKGGSQWVQMLESLMAQFGSPSSLPQQQQQQ